MTDAPTYARADIDVAYRRGRRTGIWIGFAIAAGLPMGLILLVIIVLTVLTEAGTIPGLAAVPGADLPDAVLELLVEEGVIDEGDEVLYYYSDGFLSFREDGNLFTETSVISYWEESGQLQIMELSYPWVTAIEPTFDEGLFGTSRVKIDGTGGSTFQLLVGNEDGLDEHFVELLVRTWTDRRRGDPVAMGDEIASSTLEFLRDEGVIAADEELRCFYTKAIDSLREDGNLITDRRVASYWDGEDALVVEDAELAHVADVQVTEGGAMHGLTEVLVVLEGDETIDLWVSPEDDGDERFVALLRDAVEAARATSSPHR